MTTTTLVLLHPLPLDGSIWSDEVRSLGPRTIAPTLYGYGDTLEAWASGVINEAGGGQLVVIGNSVGGSCALEIARLAPDRVRLVVLIGTKAAHRPQPDLRDQALELLTHDGVAAAWDRYWARLFAPNTDPAVVAAARAVALQQSVDHLAAGIRAFHGRRDRSDLLGTLDIPTLIVSGEHDPFAHGRGQVVEGAGHYVPLERPAELAVLIRAELESVAW